MNGHIPHQKICLDQIDRRMLPPNVRKVPCIYLSRTNQALNGLHEIMNWITQHVPTRRQRQQQEHRRAPGAPTMQAQPTASMNSGTVSQTTTISGSSAEPMAIPAGTSAMLGSGSSVGGAQFGASSSLTIPTERHEEYANMIASRAGSREDFEPSHHQFPSAGDASTPARRGKEDGQPLGRSAIEQFQRTASVMPPGGMGGGGGGGPMDSDLASLKQQREALDNQMRSMGGGPRY